ncbi:MAG: hypothetical protein SOV20_08895 [Coriobacteriales bacterium]|nr:hypothetical protein [Coriobacteriales bacterium]
MSDYTTKTDTIAYEIEPALGEHASEYDLDAMADELFEYDERDGFKLREDVDFWEVAQRNELAEA